jgi:hypothetical protein
MALKEPWLFANGTEERRLAGSDQASLTDVFASHRHKRTGFDVALRVYMERHPSCPGAAILLPILIVRELAEDDRFAPPELKNTISERGSCRFIKDPVGPGVCATGYVFGEEANGAANGHHFVNELIGG